MSYVKFSDMITSEIDDINFLSIYNKINDELVYDPILIKKIIQYTIYNLENKRKLTGEINGCLNFHLNIVRGLNEDRKELDRIELLYIIQLCEKLNNDVKKSSLDNMACLYN